MKKHLFSVMSCAVLLGIFSAFPVSAQENVEEVIQFQPETIQDNVFDEVLVTTIDGEEHVIVSGNSKAGGEIDAYEISLDRQDNTYSVVEKEPTELATNTLSALAATTSHTGWVKAITDDPVGVDLCSTKLTLSWYDYGSTIGYQSRNLTRWAANPSSLGTHWYSSGGTLVDYSLNSGKTVLTQRGYGYFYNYDFLDDDKITNVNHDITIKAQNDGTYDYVVDWTRSGESWITLDLDIETN